ncbi:PEP-CTERM sorting domain-containing protein [Adhaeretor mobilis]|uniref:Ice-binding protein C-terminal domain-containing protein n=1 Tax=Adhaeretor mobilis TaxID=1930276 RepID=A0A517MQ74_9BACT|nr:PEP-CTERM sorting domain-containing protein [Adhaeretor mobilis]QDS97028.1 hypothetical protein HG15A2_02870 [Adhaeretor mobilis]
MTTLTIKEIATIKRTTFRSCAVTCLVALCPLLALADEQYTPVVNPVSPLGVDVVPEVARVPGKHFTDSRDMNYQTTPHSVSPTQIGQWDGTGGAQNGLHLASFNGEMDVYEIDAMAQIRDPLLNAVVANRTSLVVSTSFDQMLGNDTSLAVERTNGAAETFAVRSQIVSHNHPGGLLRDIDSVDLWGREDVNRAGFYSFQGDPNNTAIYTHQILAPGGVQPYVSSLQVALALGNPDLEPLLDIDALMVRDIGTGFNPFDGTFGAGDSILFSIAPIPNPNGGPNVFDGGEVWHWRFGQQAEFLKHGGHLWDTAFDVQGTFGTQSENIDALEAVSAVPEPTSLLLGATGLACLWCGRRRRIA